MCFLNIFFNIFSKPENADVWIFNFDFTIEHNDSGGFSHGERLEESYVDTG